MRRAATGFTLIEIMLSVLFICIAFFGYVALHSRLLHSGRKLEEKELLRANTDLVEGLEVSRILLGMTSSVTREAFEKHPLLDDLYLVRTDLENRDMTWVENLPPEYKNDHAQETIELEPRVMKKPFSYSWEKR